MMNFRLVKNAIKTILSDAAIGRYIVVGNQKQKKSAEEFTGNNRLVEVFFKTENFDKGRGRLNGPVNGDVTIAMELTVSAPAEADLATINDPGSTAVEVQAALLGIKESSEAADDSMDELFDIVYQIIMDAKNVELGLPDGVVANRWISSINKDTPNPSGGLITLSGFLDFSCRVDETVDGDVGVDFVQTDFVTEIGSDIQTKTGIVIT